MFSVFTDKNMTSTKSNGSIPTPKSTAHHRFIMENISVYSAIPANDHGHRPVPPFINMV